VGLIGSANGSTLFLDEIGDMPEEVQPMFLRVAEHNGEYFRLGEESRLQRSDFRLVGATNRPEKMRYELKRRFEREIRVPSLNRRKEDIPLLMRHLLTAHVEKDDIDVQRFLEGRRPRVHPLLIEQLVHHTYTTNVSEVAFLLGHAMAESPGEVMCPLRDGVPNQAHSTEKRSSELSPTKKRASQPLPSVAQAQRALDEHGGHITRTAAALGISRDQLNRMIRREGLLLKRPKRWPGDPSTNNGAS
jgi:DNA-binding NtrC family response regulator